MEALRLIFKTLRLRNFSEAITLCYDAQKALDMLKDSVKLKNGVLETDYCLILSDLNMPLMNGYEFAKNLRQLFASLGLPKDQHPKLVAISGNVESAYI